MSKNRVIYKISPKPDWDVAITQGHFKGAPIDIADGFIHFSTAAQVAETATKHFTGQSNLTLAAIDSRTLGDSLKYEVSRGDALFPHLYADLDMSCVLWTKPMPLNEDGVPQVPRIGSLIVSFLYDSVGRKALFAVDAERAHGLSIAALKSGLHPRFGRTKTYKPRRGFRWPVISEPPGHGCRL